MVIPYYNEVKEYGVIDEERLFENLEAVSGEQRELWLEIYKSHRQWQATIDAVGDYIFVTDSSRFIKRANKSFAARFGKHPRDIIGMPVSELFAGEFPSLDWKWDHEGDTGAPSSREIRLGQETYVLSEFPAKYDDDEVYVCVMKDITELIQLKNKLYHSYKIASLGLLVSGVAHEINNPLTGIIGFTELLRMRVQDEGVKRELDKIYKAADRCKHIIESLLFFSRQQSSQRNLEYVNDIIEKMIGLRSYWLRTHSVEVVTEFRRVPLAYIDGQQIQQALMNIFTNAEQAIAESRRKGTITVGTDHDETTREVIIRISDNGNGISEDDLPRIFDPFFTTKPVNQGTGLGLSIVHGIIAEHGGTISVKSAVGEGTTFTIRLPLK